MSNLGQFTPNESMRHSLTVSKQSGSLFINKGECNRLSFLYVESSVNNIDMVVYMTFDHERDIVGNSL